MSHILEVQIMPTTGSLVQQGMDVDYIEVEPGETFDIKKKYRATVECEEHSYILHDKDEFTGHTEVIEGEDTLLLTPGRYLFHEDGIIIEKLK